MGLDDQPRAGPALQLAPRRPAAGLRDHPHRARLQPARRRPARRTRSAAESMTDAAPNQTPIGGRGSPLTTETLTPLTAPQVEELVPSEAARRRPRHERGAEALLRVAGLRTSFQTRDALVQAVSGIDFQGDRCEIV